MLEIFKLYQSKYSLHTFDLLYNKYKNFICKFSFISLLNLIIFNSNSNFYKILKINLHALMQFIKILILIFMNLFYGNSLIIILLHKLKLLFITF